MTTPPDIPNWQVANTRERFVFENLVQTLLNDGTLAPGDVAPDLSDYPTREQVTAAISGAILTALADYDTNEQIQALVTSALASYETTTAINAAISTALANYDTIAQVDSAISSALSSGSYLRYKGAYTGQALAIGDAISYNGHLYQATQAVAASSAAQYVGSSIGKASTVAGTIALPAGAQAGDLCVAINTNYGGAYSNPTGFTAGTSVTDSTNTIGYAYKTLTSGDITAGTIAQPSTGTWVTALYVFRNASVDTANVNTAAATSVAPSAMSGDGFEIQSRGGYGIATETETQAMLGVQAASQVSGGANGAELVAGYTVQAKGSTAPTSVGSDGTNPVAINIPVVGVAFPLASFQLMV